MGDIYAKVLNETFHSLLEQDPRVLILGEDIADPYGGAFKISRGLTTRFPERVRTTPVSEAAITGMAAGAALAGFRPIVEIMFGDFSSLCFDQIVNHITKYKQMYDDQVSCPVIIRTPMGGGRAYGPTHSQSLEKHYLGVPNLLVVGASLHHDPKTTFEWLLDQDDPALFVEHKLLYGRPLSLSVDGRVDIFEVKEEGSPGVLPTVCLAPVERSECAVTVISYGYQAQRVLELAARLALEEEIFVETVIPGLLSPIDWAGIEPSVAATGRVLTVEEGTAGWSWGTGIAAGLHERLFGKLEQPVRVLTSASSIIPSARSLEEQMLLSLDTIEKTIREMIR